MQRYVIKGLDPYTYTIADRRDTKLYMLCVVDVISPAANFGVVVAEAAYEDTKYCTFTKEVLNFSFWARNWQQVLLVVEGFFGNLYSGADISNPVAESLAVGHMQSDGRLLTYTLPKKVLH